MVIDANAGALRLEIRSMFAYIRNVQGLRFNHKRVYRIYCELALN